MDAVTLRDFPVVQACCLIFATTFILLNLIADVVAIITNPDYGIQSEVLTMSIHEVVLALFYWPSLDMLGILGKKILCGYQ